MHGAEIPHRGPELGRPRVDWDVFVDGSHGLDPVLEGIQFAVIRSTTPSFRGASLAAKMMRASILRWASEPGIHNHDREYGLRACASKSTVADLDKHIAELG